MSTLICGKDFRKYQKYYFMMLVYIKNKFLLIVCLIVSVSFIGNRGYAKTNATVDSAGRHAFLGLAITTDGWTNLFTCIKKDSHIIYVSTSGNDDNGQYYTLDSPEIGPDPFLPKMKVRSYVNVWKALQQVRAGYPDVVLLKRGDVWHNVKPLQLQKSGRNKQERLLIAAYGMGRRPELRTIENEGGFRIKGSNIIIADLSFAPESRSHKKRGGTGVLWMKSSSDVLVEGCSIAEYDNGVVMESRQANGNPIITNIAFRRNVIVDSWGGKGAHGQGLYAHQVNNILIEENLWDHNGWHDTLKKQNIFDRSIYLSRVGNAKVRGNIDARGSSGGIQMRSGGLYEYNLSLQNPIAIAAGHAASISDGTSIIRHNVVLDSRNISDSPRGIAISVGNRQVNSVIHDNIIAHQRSGTGNIFAITITNEKKMSNQEDAGSMGRAASYPYVRNTTISDNIIYKWGQNGGIVRGAKILKIGQAADGCKIIGNSIQSPEGAIAAGYKTGSVSKGPLVDKWVFSQNQYYSDSGQLVFEIESEEIEYAEWIKSVHETDASNKRPTFPDPERTIQTYVKDVLGVQNIGYEESLELFLQRARLQSRSNWSSGLTGVSVINYIREGYGRQRVDMGYSFE